MKTLKKMLSITLSLVLCLSMVAPALAASFTELQTAIDTGESVYKDEGKSEYKIEASKDEETGAVNVKLYEDVEFDKETDTSGIVIKQYDDTKEGRDVTIDLNGHDIDLNPDAVLNVDDGEFYEAKKDEDGNKIATENKAEDLNKGSVITVDDFSKLTLTDSSETGTPGSEEDPYTSGKITGGNTNGYGGGVKSPGEFAMSGGSIEGNKANQGGGVANLNHQFTMSGGAIAGNTATGRGGGIFAGGAVTLSGTAAVEGNSASGRRSGPDISVAGSRFEDTREGARWLIDEGNVVWAYTGTYGGNNPTPLKAAELDEEGNIVIPGGSTVKDSTGATKEYPNGAIIDKDGNVIGTTVTEPGDDGSVTITTTTNGKNPVKTTVTLPEGGKTETDEHSNTKIPNGSVVTDKDGNVTDLPFGGTIDKDGNVTVNPDPNAGNGGTGVTPGTTTINDEQVPLSGIFTRGDAIGYLWQQAGSPEWELSDFEDVPKDHEWAVAIGWAQEMGIAVADEEGNFRPDDLVLRSTEDVEGELQEFLNRYAVYAGIELDADELFIELDGAADDVIMGEEAQVIFADFFAKLEVALAQVA